MPGAPPDEPEAPTPRQLVYDNFTAETLVRGNHANPRGVAVCKDELSGLVAALNQYKKGQGDDRQNLLSMWAGAALTCNREKDRVAGVPPLTLTHTFLAVAGMIQPDLLAVFRGDTGRGPGGNDGWADRFLLSFPDVPPARGENRAVVPEGLEAGYAEVVRAALAWDMVPVADAGGDVVAHRPHHVPLDAAAVPVWEQFTHTVADRTNALDPLDGYRGVLSKSRHHTLRLTALVHAVRRACGEVGASAPVAADTVARAVALMGYFEAHGRRCLGVGWLDQPCRVAKRLLGWLARNPEIGAFTRSDAFIQLKDGRDVPRSEMLNRPLQLLADLNYIRPVPAPVVRSGPAAETYQVNPAWVRSTPHPVPEVPNVAHPSDEQALNFRDSGDDFATGGDAHDPGDGRHDGEGHHDDEGGSGVRDGGAPETPRTGPQGAVPMHEGGTADHTTTGEVAPEVIGPSDEGAGEGAGVAGGAPAPLLTTTPDGARLITDAVTGWGGAVGLDTETTGPDPVRDRVRLIQVAAGEDVAVVDVFALPDPAADLAPLFAALGAREVVGHNLQFDLRFLAPLGFVPGAVFDTMLASQVLHAGDRGDGGARVGHGLAEVAERELGRALDKSQQKSDWSGALTAAQVRYAAADAAVLVPLAAALRAKLAAAGLTATAELEMRALPGVAWARPVALDRTAWVALADRSGAERRRLADEMDALAPDPAGLPGIGFTNWNSPDQVRAAFARVGVALASTGDDALAGVTHPLAGALRAYRGCAKQAGTYGRDWIEKHARGGVVLPQWWQLGAESGRMSCAAPNLQQIPRGAEYRRCFVARPGHVLVKADYSQIELRIAARVADEGVMVAAYREGRDLHALTAAAVLNKPAAEVTKADRQLAKAVNFGLLYGMGWRGLQKYAKGDYGVELTDPQARGYRDAFFNAYPALARWHARTAAVVERLFNADPAGTHEVRTLGGRRRVLPVAKTGADGRSYPNVTDALNTPVQGTGADALKAAIALLWERRGECPGAVPVLFCHDEIVLEAPAARAGDAADWLRRCMTDAAAPLIAPVPVDAEVQVGATWAG